MMLIHSHILFVILIIISSLIYLNLNMSSLSAKYESTLLVTEEVSLYRNVTWKYRFQISFLIIRITLVVV